MSAEEPIIRQRQKVQPLSSPSPNGHRIAVSEGIARTQGRVYSDTLTSVIKPIGKFTVDWVVSPTLSSANYAVTKMMHLLFSPVLTREGYRILKENIIGIDSETGTWHFNGNNLLYLCYTIGIIGMNVCHYFVMKDFYEKETEFQDVITAENVTEESFDKAFLGIVWILALWVVRLSASSWLCDNFSSSLSKDDAVKMFAQYHEDDAFNGIKGAKENSMPRLINDDLSTVNSVVSLFSKRLDTLSDFVTAVFSLMALSSFVIELSAITMVTAYVGGFYVLLSYLGGKYKALNSEVKETRDKLNNSLSDLERCSSSITALGGSETERKKNTAYVEELLNLESWSMFYKALIKGVGIFNSMGTLFFGMFLFKTKLINKVVKHSELFPMGAQIGNIIRCITWHREKISEISDVETSRKRIDDHMERIRQSIDTKVNSQLDVDVNLNHKFALCFKGEITKHKDPAKILVATDEIALERGYRYLVRGDSNIGKSSWMKVLAGQEHNVNPGTKLELVSKPVYMPQVPYVSKQPNTLLFNILYPTKTEEEIAAGEVDPETIERIKRYMQFLNLNKEDDLDTIDIWGKEGEVLSGGEIKKLALIRMLVTSKPDVLLMDEVTAGLDETSKDRACELIRSELEGVTILEILHLSKLESQFVIKDYYGVIEFNKDENNPKGPARMTQHQA